MYIKDIYIKGRPFRESSEVIAVFSHCLVLLNWICPVPPNRDPRRVIRDRRQVIEISKGPGQL